MSGFGKGDKIDLTNLAYSRREYAIWNDQNGGTLNVYAGAALVTSILVSGDYAANSFAVVDDGSRHAEVVAATTDRWTEVTHSGRWNNASNWNNGNGGVPTSTTNALIDKSGTYEVVISGGARELGDDRQCRCHAGRLRCAHDRDARQPRARRGGRRAKLYY